MQVAITGRDLAICIQLFIASGNGSYQQGCCVGSQFSTISSKPSPTVWCDLVLPVINGSTTTTSRV